MKGNNRAEEKPSLTARSYGWKWIECVPNAASLSVWRSWGDGSLRGGPGERNLEHRAVPAAGTNALLVGGVLRLFLFLSICDVAKEALTRMPLPCCLDLPAIRIVTQIIFFIKSLASCILWLQHKTDQDTGNWPQLGFLSLSLSTIHSSWSVPTPVVLLHFLLLFFSSTLEDLGPSVALNICSQG